MSRKSMHAHMCAPTPKINLDLHENQTNIRVGYGTRVPSGGGDWWGEGMYPAAVANQEKGEERIPKSGGGV